MSTETMQELTLHLPTDIVERIRQTAARRGQQPDEVVTEILGVSLLPRGYDVEPRLRRTMESLANKSEEEIKASANARLPAADQSRLSELLARNREESLTPKESEELEALLDKAEEPSAEKATAKWLLANRTGKAGLHVGCR